MSQDGGWPIGIRLEVLDGQTVPEKFANANAYGFDAVEPWARPQNLEAPRCS